MGAIKIFTGLIILFTWNAKPIHSSKNDFKKITAINLIYKMPVVMWDSTIKVLETTYNVYYYEDLIMYKLNYEFDSSVNRETVLEEKRSYYFVFQKDSIYGFKYFIKPSWESNQRLNKDSLLKTNKLESNTYDTLVNYKPDSVYNKRDKIVKVYKDPSNHATNQSEKFDLYFYYSKDLKDIPETFSRKMDNESGMKLYKIIVAARGGYYKEYKLTFPPREFLLEMKEIIIENQEEILRYFKSYKEQ